MDIQILSRCRQKKYSMTAKEKEIAASFNSREDPLLVGSIGILPDDDTGPSFYRQCSPPLVTWANAEAVVS